MASFTIYDPKTKLFRAVETADTADLPFDQVLLINILIELRVITHYMQLEDSDPPMDDPDEVRTALVQEIGSLT